MKRMGSASLRRRGLAWQEQLLWQSLGMGAVRSRSSVEKEMMIKQDIHCFLGWSLFNPIITVLMMQRGRLMMILTAVWRLKLNCSTKRWSIFQVLPRKSGLALYWRRQSGNVLKRLTNWQNAFQTGTKVSSRLNSHLSSLQSSTRKDVPFYHHHYHQVCHSSRRGSSINIFILLGSTTHPPVTSIRSSPPVLKQNPSYDFSFSDYEDEDLYDDEDIGIQQQDEVIQIAEGRN